MAARWMSRAITKCCDRTRERLCDGMSPGNDGDDEGCRLLLCESVVSPTMSQQDEDVIKKWGTSAPYWEKHRDVIRGMFAPITQALLHDAEIASGNTILDVATGPG